MRTASLVLLFASAALPAIAGPIGSIPAMNLPAAELSARFITAHAQFAAIAKPDVFDDAPAAERHAMSKRVEPIPVPAAVAEPVQLLTASSDEFLSPAAPAREGRVSRFFAALKAKMKGEPYNPADLRWNPLDNFLEEIIHVP